MTIQLREPEYIEVKVLDIDHPLRDIPKMRLSALILVYQEALLKYYFHRDRYGELRYHATNTLEPKEYDHGTDQQRERWNRAARQELLWNHVSILNGELLRRLYHGRQYAVELMDRFRKHLEDEVAFDASLPPAPSEKEAEMRDAEEYPCALSRPD